MSHAIVEQKELVTDELLEHYFHRDDDHSLPRIATAQLRQFMLVSARVLRIKVITFTVIYIYIYIYITIVF